MNVLWIHYFTQNDPEGDKIWSEYMIDNPKIQYYSILRVAYKKNKPELMEDLLKLLETAKHVDDNAKGYVYSELIKYYCNYMYIIIYFRIYDKYLMQTFN